MNYKDQSYYKNFQKYLKEDEEILGSTGVVPLSKINKDAAQAAISGGMRDGSNPDDVVTGKKVSVAAKDLKAAQTEIIPGKALGIAFGMLKSGKIGGDLGSIISQDPFIMDGHHRWAATFLCDPNGTVTATQIDLPGTALVTALNLITVGKLGKSGNPGKGNIADFKGSVIGTLIDELLVKGIFGDYPQSPEEVKTNLGKVPGANGDATKGKEIMMKNADTLPKDIMPDAPARVEMPVIGEKEVAIVQKFLEKGVVDIKPPYSPDVKKALGLESKIQKRLDNYLQESIKKASK